MQLDFLTIWQTCRAGVAPASARTTTQCEMLTFIPARGARPSPARTARVPPTCRRGACAPFGRPPAVSADIKLISPFGQIGNYQISLKPLNTPDDIKSICRRGFLPAGDCLRARPGAACRPGGAARAPLPNQGARRITASRKNRKTQARGAAESRDDFMQLLITLYIPLQKQRLKGGIYTNFV